MMTKSELHKAYVEMNKLCKDSETKVQNKEFIQKKIASKKIMKPNNSFKSNMKNFSNKPKNLNRRTGR